MLTMEYMAILLIVFLGEMVRAYPQGMFGGSYGVQGSVQPMMGSIEGGGAAQPIMPVNGSPNPFVGYGMQQQYAAPQQQQLQMPQMVRRYGQSGGFQQQHAPQQQFGDIYQQQQLMQQMMLQQQQQQRLQQIRPVGNFQSSYGQNVQGFMPQQPPHYNFGGAGMPQPQAIQPAASSPISPANIPMQVVIDRRPANTIPPTPGKSSNSELPRFLEGAGPEVVDEFKHIIRQPNTSYSEQVKQIDGLVHKLDQPHQELYKVFMKENDDREQEHRDKIHQTVAKMSDKAQEQFAKISAVLRNPGVPDQERWDRVLSLYGNMDPELRNEFEQKFKGFGPTPPNYFI
uniref:SXP/RAL-2 family protein Ani s 5-like cation-binding domain-containing protein n=1 Tax=Ditylenchus dipsaci TaxID=166011 RepID=A0A915D6V6_9BILA